MDDIPLPSGETIASSDEFQAMLEAEEGPPLPMYDDKAPGHNRTIGYGFNLRDTIDLAFVLNQISYGGVNVFTQAAKIRTDSSDQYQFIPSGGELKITPKSGGASAWTIDVLGFNLAQASSLGGFLGIELPESRQC